MFYVDEDVFRIPAAVSLDNTPNSGDAPIRDKYEARKGIGGVQADRYISKGDLRSFLDIS